MASILAGFEVLIYFFPAMVIGVLIRRRSHGTAHRVDKVANTILKITLYLILFTMGWRLATDPQVTSQLGILGFQALAFAFVGAMASIIATSFFLESGLFGQSKAKREASPQEPNQEPSQVPRLGLGDHLERLKGPLIMMGVVALGSVLAIFIDPLFPLPIGPAASWILRFMIASVGLSMGCADLSALKAIRNPRFFLLPLVTLLATVFSGIALGLVWGIGIGQGGALASGFGWYSLSAVLISEGGFSVLAATAFMTNLFRESIAILCMGFLQAMGRPLSGISAAGATSMDVSLPLIALHRHGAYTPLAVYHGFALSLAVPVLVPLFLALI